MDRQGASVNPVDASGRITLREHHLDELEDSVVLTQGFDENLLMFTPEQWSTFRMRIVGGDEMDPDMDDLRRLFIAPATEVDLDDRGRLKLPEALRGWAGLKPGTSRAVVLNIGTRFEIWEEAHYRQYMRDRASHLKEIARRRFGSRTEEASAEV
ncbi:MAG: division/cell wall cluster transcriptional repressor MraZ [Armatimonadota bacterium]